MSDWQVATNNLKEIIGACIPGRPLAERCALYAGARALLEDLRAHVAHSEGSSYAEEKVRFIGVSVGAALGFGDSRGHPESSHRVWALGDLQTLEGLLRDMEGAE